MFSAILKILAAKNVVSGIIHITAEEFYLIKEFFDDSVHLIYAQEKNHSRDGDLTKNETWQAVYALAKDTLISCNQMMNISYRNEYINNQVVSTPVYVVNKAMITALIRLSNRLNSIHGLADGTGLSTILQELRGRDAELEQRAEAVTPSRPPQEESFYHRG
jgi:hypothetical protein